MPAYKCIKLFDSMNEHSETHVGHSGYFHVLAVVNSAAVNIGIHVSCFWIMVSSHDISPVVGLLGHIAVLFLVFLKEIPYCSPQWKWKSCLTLYDPMDYTVHGIFQDRILEWVAIPFSRGSSQPGDQTQVSHIAGRFFYQLRHQGSPRILEWAAYPFSSGSSQTRNQTKVFCFAGRFFTNWAIREAQNMFKFAHCRN